MRALEHVIMSGQDELALQAGLSLGLEQVVHAAQALDICHLEVVAAVLLLSLQVDVAIRALGRPADLAEAGDALQGDGDALQPVGQLDRYRIEKLPASLLEVGELGDLLPIEPDFPAQAPGAQGGRLPVILHKADIVLARVDAERLERRQVKLLRVAGVGLEDDLELVVHLHAVGVFAVAPVVGADGWLDVGDIPGLGTQDAQRGGGVERAGADLGVIGLPDQTTVARPEILQGHDDGLKVKRLRHISSRTRESAR